MLSMGMIAEALFALPAKLMDPFILESFVSFVVVESGFVIRFNLSSSSNKYFKQPANGHCALRAGSYPYIVNGSFAVTVYFFNDFVYFLASKHLT